MGREYGKLIGSLKACHKIMELNKIRLMSAEKSLEIRKKEVINYFELLGTNKFEDHEFKVSLRKYRKVVVTDKKAFLGWLKVNCTPDEVVEFITPPTTSSDLKKFVEDKMDKDPILDIPGIDSEVTFIKVKTEFKEKL